MSAQEQGRGPVVCGTCRFLLKNYYGRQRCRPRVRRLWDPIDGVSWADELAWELNAEGRCPHHAPTWGERLARWLRGARAERPALPLAPDQPWPREATIEGASMKFGIWELGSGAWTWVDVRAVQITDTEEGMVALTLRDVHSQECVPAFERWVEMCLKGDMEGVWYAEVQWITKGAAARRMELRGAAVVETRAPRDAYHLYDTVSVRGYTREAWEKGKNLALYAPYFPLQVSSLWPKEQP